MNNERHKANLFGKRDSVLKYIERVSENGQTVTRKPERVKAA